MNYSLLIFLLSCSMALCQTTIDSANQPQVQPTTQDNPQLTPTYTQPQVNPTYQPASNQPTYSDVYPTYNGYPGEYAYSYPYPVQKATPPEETGLVRTLGTILPALRQAFHVLVKIVGKIGFLLLGGAIVLVIGGGFTAAVCALTPLCTLTFMGYGLSKEQVRSFITPDKITLASDLVSEAIDKYQKLHGAIGDKTL